MPRYHAGLPARALDAVAGLLGLTAGPLCVQALAHAPLDPAVWAVLAAMTPAFAVWAVRTPRWQNPAAGPLAVALAVGARCLMAGAGNGAACFVTLDVVTRGDRAMDLATAVNTTLAASVLGVAMGLPFALVFPLVSGLTRALHRRQSVLAQTVAVAVLGTVVAVAGLLARGVALDGLSQAAAALTLLGGMVAVAAAIPSALAVARTAGGVARGDLADHRVTRLDGVDSLPALAWSDDPRRVLVYTPPVCAGGAFRTAATPRALLRVPGDLMATHRQALRAVGITALVLMVLAMAAARVGTRPHPHAALVNSVRPD